MPKRRWRDYRTASGRRPVREFLGGLSDSDVAAIVAAMKEVQTDGVVATRRQRWIERPVDKLAELVLAVPALDHPHRGA